MRYTNEANTSCLAAVTCYFSKYRTIDGSCNSVNVNLTRLGQSITTYRRLLAPAYLDGIFLYISPYYYWNVKATLNPYGIKGISSPRTNSSINTTTNALPSARLVSTKVFAGADAPLSNVTSLLMQFGQFLNHDMESTTDFTFGKKVNHCKYESILMFSFPPIYS